jgi:hypothetical protein
MSFLPRFTQQNDATSRPTGCYAETAVGQSPLLSLSQQPKNCIGGPEADPSCSVTCISLRLAMLACGSSLAASTAWYLEEKKAANNI